MGRGKDKTFRVQDVMQMSDKERKRYGLTGEGFRRQARFSGTAVVIGKDGNPKYDEGAKPGSFNEDQLS